MNKNSSNELSAALERHCDDYGVTLNSSQLNRLIEYFELLSAWNERLHLVAPTSPAEFARRHILESLMMTRYLPTDTRIADIGSGGGLPIVPCLIARPDLKAVLIESSKKKAIFLREAVARLDTSTRGTVIAERFQEIECPGVDFVSCRAVERFESLVPAITGWAPTATFVFFGSSGLAEILKTCGLHVTSTLIPHSEKRFIHVAIRPIAQKH